MDVSFTLGEIEERDFEVVTQPGRDNISVCTRTGFCLRETGRNVCPCRSAQQLPSSTRNRKFVQCVLQEDSSENNEVFKSILFFSCGKICVQLQNALYFINYLCFFLTFHRVRLTNNSVLSLHSTDWKSTLSILVSRAYDLFGQRWDRRALVSAITGCREIHDIG